MQQSLSYPVHILYTKESIAKSKDIPPRGTHASGSLATPLGFRPNPASRLARAFSVPTGVASDLPRYAMTLPPHALELVEACANSIRNHTAQYR